MLSHASVAHLVHYVQHATVHATCCTLPPSAYLAHVLQFSRCPMEIQEKSSKLSLQRLARKPPVSTTLDSSDTQGLIIGFLEDLPCVAHELEISAL